MKKFDQLLVYCYQITIEMSLVDLCFSTTFNIEGDYSNGPTSFYIGKFASLFILSMILIHYLNLFIIGQKKFKTLSKFERELMEEGLNKKAFIKFKSVRVLNTTFKLKTVFMMVIIVIA